MIVRGNGPLPGKPDMSGNPTNQDLTPIGVENRDW
jgi:hypothetical protein